MKFGVLYLLTATDHAARLVVSLFSLRRYYSGPVTIFSTRSQAEIVCDLLAKEPRLQPLTIESLSEFSLDSPDRKFLANSNYLTKVLAAEQSPFEVTVFLDADTLIVGDIQPLVDSALCSPITVTEFAGWKTTDHHYQTHFATWLELAESNPTVSQLEKRLSRLVKTPMPVINTGVFSIHARSKVIEPWKELASLGRSCSIPDEMALQLLLSDFEHKRLSTAFNCSPLYCNTKLRSNVDVRIWHFANASHLRDASSRAIWLPAYEECRRIDVAEITKWSKVETEP